jgi:hypothetical protein
LLSEFKSRGDSSLKDLTLLCGDFNIHRDPLNEEVIKFLYSRDAAWVDHLGELDREYHRLFETLHLDGVFHVENLWDAQRPGEQCITIGDVKIDASGNKVPVDTVLTDDDMLLAEMCLDYIFQIKLDFGKQTQPKISVEDQSMKVQKNLVAIGEKGAFGNTRVYGQLSDHYGLSLNLLLK